MPPTTKYEQQLKKKGFSVIAGVDEAGRGPLAGPVVVAAVILPARFQMKGLDDSKKLSESKRAVLYEQIIKIVDYGVGVIDQKVIEEKNILQATFLAMNAAVSGLSKRPDHILFDGNRYNKTLSIPQTTLVKGDSLSNSIAAASIIAKVVRDKMMLAYHKQFPDYEFDQHKGYGTKRHIAAIKRYGPCDLHRKTFLVNILNEQQVLQREALCPKK